MLGCGNAYPKAYSASILNMCNQYAERVGEYRGSDAHSYDQNN